MNSQNKITCFAFLHVHFLLVFQLSFDKQLDAADLISRVVSICVVFKKSSFFENIPTVDFFFKAGLNLNLPGNRTFVNLIMP